MSTTEPIRLGIMGLGRAGMHMHAPELKGKEAMFRIVAACDAIPERVNHFRDTYGARTYATPQALLRDPNVEAVSIATRSVNHFKHARLALAAGKHVFLEKPMTATYRQAVKLRELAQASPGKLIVRHNRYWERCFQHVNEIIASGILGDVFEIRLRRDGYQRRDDWQTIKEFGGGQMLNWGPHIVQHALHFLDYRVADVWSHLRRVAACGDAEDHLKIVLLGASGRLVDVGISGGLAIKGPVYFVAGTRGALISEDEQTLHLRYLDPAKPLPPRQADPGTPGASGFGSKEDLPWMEETLAVSPRFQGDMTSCWDAFYEDVRHDKPFPVSLDQAIEVMRIISLVKKGTEFAG